MQKLPQKFTPEEFKSLIKESAGKSYIPHETQKKLKEQGFGKSFYCSTHRSKVLQALEVLKKEKLVSGYRGYTSRSPKNIIFSWLKKQPQKQESKKTTSDEKRGLSEQGQKEKKKTLETEKLWERRIEAHREYLRRERIRKEQKTQTEKRGELKTKIPDTKEVEDLPLAI